MWLETLLPAPQIMVAGGGAEVRCGLTHAMDVTLDWLTSWTLSQYTGFWGEKSGQRAHGNLAPFLRSLHLSGWAGEERLQDQWMAAPLEGPLPFLPGQSRFLRDMSLSCSSLWAAAAPHRTARSWTVPHSLALTSAHRCLGPECSLAPGARTALDASCSDLAAY